MNLAFVFGSIGRTPFVTANPAWKAETGWKWFVFFRFGNRTDGKGLILLSPVSARWVTVAPL
jgi:hypothetical protein